ncbi:MAG: hypothetical protein KF889_12765 [Alphaproteobacteria bacterium]|nr:hypothetical protein [Alphaproteobacteria bacterium]MCW5739134.1 hypothetical protein [Alphaproteobacteria bacterium]
MRTAIIALGVVLVAPIAAAQGPQADRDLAYCEQLFDMHGRYVAYPTRRGGTVRDGMADLAVDRCRNGRFAEGIPILEVKLQRVRIPLPQR